MTIAEFRDPVAAQLPIYTQLVEKLELNLLPGVQLLDLDHRDIISTFAISIFRQGKIFGKDFSDVYKSKILLYLPHFSCPSRTCPNPDVVKPVWEKHIRDKMSGITKTLTSGATPVNKKVAPAVTMAGKKRRAVMVPDPPATISTSSKIVIKAARTGSPGMPSPAPPPPVSTTATTSASGTTNDAVSTTQCTTVMNVAGTGSSLLRDALMLPKSPLPRAIISLNNNVKGTTTFLHHNYASLPLLRDEHRESTSASKVGTYLHIVVPKVRPPKY